MEVLAHGKIGKDAQAMWDEYPELRPDYEKYLTRTKAITEVDERIIREENEEAEEVAKLLEEERLEQEKLAEETKLKEEKRKNKIIIDTKPLLIHND